MGLKDKVKKIFQRSKKKDVVSPRGMAVAASSCDGEISSSFFDQKDEKVDYGGGQLVLFTKCGHTTPGRTKIVFWNLVSEQDFCKAKKVDNICPDCMLKLLQKHAIRCALCGCAIFLGEGVALYHKSSGGVNKEAATFVGDNVVGCTHMNCCPSGGFFAGYWTEGGFESAFESGLTIAEQALATGETVIFNVEDKKEVKK